MLDVAPALVFDAALRGMLVALLVLLAAVLARDWPRLPAARAGIVLCVGLSVQVFGATPLLEARLPMLWQVPLVAVAVGLVTAQQDRWLVPRFHSDRVLQACKSCERIADLADGGHGAPLSPLPPGLSGILGDMLNDPPGFDRQQMAAVDRKTAAFFSRHLLGGATD